MNSKDNDKTIVGGFALDLIYSILSENGEKFVITDDSLVGRGTDCEVLIDDKKISRNHAQLKIVNGRLEVTDLDSSNGTFINGSNISKPSNLVNGDVVSFEKHLYTVNISMNEQQAEVVEEDDDHTAVMDLSPEQFEKLHKSTGPKLTTKDKKEEPKVEKKEETKEKSTSQKAKKSEDKAVPSSWIEEAGASEGTRMLDMSELEALRAGPKEVKQNDSDITRLHCFIEGQEEEIFELPVIDFEQETGWEMGRDSTCDIVLDHPSVSNRHAQIIHQNGRWKIVNLVSTNGIQINGQKRLSTYLSDGDKVGMGSVNIVIKIPKSQFNKTKKSIQKSSKSSKNNLLVPVVLGLIILVLMFVIYLYM